MITTNNYDYLTNVKPSGYPVRHKRKVPFEPRIRAGADFAARSRRIRDLDHRLGRFILRADDHFKIVSEAWASNIHWSTALEGNPLQEAEVRKITDRALSGAIEHKGGPAQEIINHLVNAYAPSGYQLPWGKETLCGLNGLLLKDTGNTAVIGAYRARDACVGDAATGEEHFRPAPWQHVEEETASLLEWLNSSSAVYDPIVAATVFFHEFESIHPFEDGNGRTGRCLFHMHLKNSGLKNSHLCMIDRKLLENASMYYDLLAYADEQGTYAELLEYFSIALLSSYEDALASISEMDLLSSSMDEESRAIVIRSRESMGYFSISEARSWTPSLSEQSIAKRLKRLEEEGVLESKGRTAGLRYRFKDPLRAFRLALGNGGQR